MADLYGMLIVCPDGGFDMVLIAPLILHCASKLLLHRTDGRIDKQYASISSRRTCHFRFEHGGHGGLYVGFRNQDIFGACGSMCGGVDIRPFPNNWNMTKSLGTQREHPENWDNYTVMNQLHLLTPNAMKIIIDCGTEDFFYQVNLKLHEELCYRNIPHDFITRPGAHNGAYWSNAVKYQALYFYTFFQSSKKN